MPNDMHPAVIKPFVTANKLLAKSSCELVTPFLRNYRSSTVLWQKAPSNYVRGGAHVCEGAQAGTVCALGHCRAQRKRAESVDADTKDHLPDRARVEHAH